MQSPYIHISHYICITFRIIYPLSRSRPFSAGNEGRKNIRLRYYYTVDTKQKMFYAAIPAELEAKTIQNPTASVNPRKIPVHKGNANIMEFMSWIYFNMYTCNYVCNIIYISN